MEELRALCGAPRSAASIVASVVKTHDVSLDMNEFTFVSTTLPLILWKHRGKQVPREFIPMAVRYLVEMCDWSDISGNEGNAADIFVYIIRQIADTVEPLCEEWEQILRVFTPAVVQRIHDGRPEFGLPFTLFSEGVTATHSLALRGLAVIPDTVLFDVHQTDYNTFLKNNVETSITHMVRWSGAWEWEPFDDADNKRAGVLGFLKVCLERMPTNGFLSRREEVHPGMNQCVLHSIFYEILEIYRKASRATHFLGPVSEVLQLFFQTPRLTEDIMSIKDETSYHYFSLDGVQKMGWHGITLEEMVARRSPDLLPIIASTVTKGAFDE